MQEKEVNVVNVISGKNLIKYKDRTDLAPEFVKQLDPDGYNLIEFEFMHNDSPLEMRLVMMFKLINREEPYDAAVTIHTGVLNKIRETMTIDTEIH